MKLLRVAIVVLMDAMLLWSSVNAQGLVPAIIAFGDSTVDAGNNNYVETVFRSNFPPYGRDFDTKKPTGRFCNGRLVTDYIATVVSIPFPPPYLAPASKGNNIVQGINFASGGSGFLDETSKLLNAVSLKTQLQWYNDYKIKLENIVGKENASSIISGGLHVLSTGSDDYVNNYNINPDLQAKYNTAQFEQLLLREFTNFVEEIYNVGARKVAVVSLAPLGCLPSQITLYGKGSTDCIQFQNKQAASFNRELQKTTRSLKSKLSGITLVYLDIYTVLADAVKNPESYGFNQVSKSCCGLGKLAVSILCNQYTPGTCSNASTYLFWDSFHPSDAGNNVIANAVILQAASEILG
ncbi:hypothetical protein O6H91_21G035400 [Diphasiastrum complanatum]|uniref:Uncharacterized protein n=1 Tax=Diphasiastrum complanatum TaxID=34168 RepID=A0ACC2AJH6_DIPCM|nr:hypothetical protein O6H91_Y404600 [Diphasiastrum complanatum]KAJ7517688.1 hypothetical protein O6H91_21G035400 [Diphasiastrum complanatum]